MLCSRNIAHRDVKPDNILMRADGSLHCTLTDFGSAVHFANITEMHEDTVGTACYVAPEVLRKCYRPSVADMWSAGMTLWCLLTAGETPFDAPYDELTFHRVLTDKCVLPPQITKKASKAAQSFLMKLLRRRVDHRLTASGALAHPWIASVGRYEGEMEVPEAEDPVVGLIAAV
jgi:serine/threonine protein kinase